MPEIEIAVTHKFTWEQVSNLLCSAFEGGSNYWYRIESAHKPPKFEVRMNEDTICAHIDYPVNEGGYLRVSNYNAEEPEDVQIFKLDRKALKKGLQVMADKYPKHFADFLNDNDDAITADVFLQCALFGEVIYG